MAGVCLASPEDGFIQEANNKTYALVRDKDVPRWLSSGTTIGFMGSDTFMELDDAAQNRIAYSQVACTGLCFVLATRSERVSKVNERLSRGETIDIATSYPRSAKNCMGRLGSAVRVVKTVHGSVEAAPYLVPNIDGIFELVDSGRTLAENDLEIVKGDLLPVTIGAVWKSGEARPAVLSDMYFDAEALCQAVAAIEARVAAAQAGEAKSYTQQLAGDSNKLVKKLMEEVGELIAAFLTGTSSDVLEESADVLYALAIVNAVRRGSLLRALGTLAARNNEFTMTS